MQKAEKFRHFASKVYKMSSSDARKGTFKVEFLKDIEKKIQARWEEDKAYEENAPEDGGENQEKFMVTFPYPYMNGRLHLGKEKVILKTYFRTLFQN